MRYDSVQQLQSAQVADLSFAFWKKKRLENVVVTERYLLHEPSLEYPRMDQSEMLQLWQIEVMEKEEMEFS